MVGAEPAGTLKAESELSNWWLGAYFRHLWVPGYVAAPVLDRAPSVANSGFGLQATYRSDGGLSIVMGIGYMPYTFQGPVLAEGQDDQSTELVDSDLEFIYVGGSVLWDFRFHETVALELGFGIDVGLMLGRILRDEAFPLDGEFVPCEPDPDRLDNPVPGQSVDPREPDPPEGERPYCDSVDVTDDPSEEGEHYGVVDDRVWPVVPFPNLPHVALRVTPVEHMAVKLEFGFGIVQMWVGLSLHGSLAVFETRSQDVVEPDVAPDAFGDEGRVLGRVIEAEGDAPVAGATVRVSGRALSPLVSGQDGGFIVDRLPSGEVLFEIEHRDYLPGTCQTEIPHVGGDAHVRCRLSPRPRVGSLIGKLGTERGDPVPGGTIQLTGPSERQLVSDDSGQFSVEGLPEGAYRLRVDAEGFMLQLVEVGIESQEVERLQIILLEKPERSLVKVRSEQIEIEQQIAFRPSSAEIDPTSEGLMREIADVLLRNEQIEQVEVQGHTDSTGPRDFNMTLSQQRADAVRDWLVKAGVADARLTARGYGPDEPIRPNDTAKNRAKNRRVEFVITQRAQEGESH